MRKEKSEGRKKKRRAYIYMISLIPGLPLRDGMSPESLQRPCPTDKNPLPQLYVKWTSK
jgi:hypothetical protein